MAPAAGFTEVLEQFVGQSGPGEPAVAGRWHPGIATRPLLWLEATAIEPRRAAPSRETADRPAPLTGTPRRPRVLSREQRAALDRFVALGARLHPSYTRRELRSAFRSLARTFHPDHHPAISASEKARLSLMFNDVRNAYDVLKNITWGA
jgi:hypothetical protein